jgi:uncharacterized protein
MLELRPSCECCDRDLPADSDGAFICSFECTFCSECNASKLHGVCPNCGGDLVQRPIRPEKLLSKYPASTERIYKPEACEKSAQSRVLEAETNHLQIQALSVESLLTLSARPNRVCRVEISASAPTGHL